MDIEIRHVDGCPHVEAVVAQVDRILADDDINDRVRRRLVSDLEDARQIGFRASPTVVIDGTPVPDDESSECSLACRIAPPSEDVLRDAIEGART